MKPKKDIVEFLESHWRSILITLFITPVIVAVLPIGVIAYFYQHGYSRAVQNYFSWSNWFYTVITYFTFIVVVTAGFITLKQLRDNEKNRKLTLILELRKLYTTTEMYRAVRMIYDFPPQRINAERQLNNQRRLVSHFWLMVAWSIDEGLVTLDVVRRSFGDAINVYEKLKEVEILIRKEIDRRDYPELSEKEIEERAKYRIEVDWPVTRLYRSWKEQEKKSGTAFSKTFES
jgi:hypothetical protein